MEGPQSLSSFTAARLRPVMFLIQNCYRLYGSLDATTREWTGCIFTRARRHSSASDREGSTPLPSIIYNWIVVDGDVDPDWAEKLSSVPNDSGALTLATGERISLPDSLRIVFETEMAHSAKLSTISRCGTVIMVLKKRIRSCGNSQNWEDFGTTNQCPGFELKAAYSRWV